MDVSNLKCSGSEFQTDGPQKEKALSPYVFKETRGFKSSLEALDLKEREGVYCVINSVMYEGESSLRPLKQNKANLYSMRAFMGSQ